MEHGSEASRAGEKIVLKNCKLVITKDERERILRNVDILISEGRIETIGEVKEKADMVIDSSNYLVMPSLVDSHMHLPSKRYQDLSSLEHNISFRLKALISHGVTSMVVYSNDVEPILAAASQIGLRIRPAIKISQLRECQAKLTNLPLPPIISIEDSEECIENLPEIKEFVEKGMSVHIHIAESRQEVFAFKKRFHKTPISLLFERGILSKNTCLINPNWIASWELNLVKGCDSVIIWSPSTSMYKAMNGFFPYRELKEMNVQIAIGSCDSNVLLNSNPLKELKLASLLVRYNYWDSSLFLPLDHVTTIGERIMGVKVGRIKVGYLADLVLLDINRLLLKGLDMNKVEEDLIYLMDSGDVIKVISNGRIVFSRIRDA
ncbi:MAG: hypothetical protein DRJ66_03155 [Thermoprotei archaeon]|nr:MAG: hypothetical protein DRJ66_03155 [Thermoprotei archaeon]RLF19553.1 MAG: hypothetical protein DRZ82_05315 [Thermoprotei archaeon]